MAISNGNIPTNAGHILKSYAEHCGLDTNNFNPGKAVAGRAIPKRIRRLKRKVLDGKYSIPSTQPVKVIKQELNQKKFRMGISLLETQWFQYQWPTNPVATVTVYMAAMFPYNAFLRKNWTGSNKLTFFCLIILNPQVHYPRNIKDVSKDVAWPCLNSGCIPPGPHYTNIAW